MLARVLVRIGLGAWAGTAWAACANDHGTQGASDSAPEVADDVGFEVAPEVSAEVVAAPETVADSASDNGAEVAAEVAAEIVEEVASEACPAGVVCVDAFPFHHAGDTAGAASDSFDHYACAATKDESGPEIVFRVAVPADGFLSAAVYDDAGVDIDVHILSAPDAAACLDRGDHHARADVSAGFAWVVADSYTNASGPQAGPFTIDIGFLAPSRGACAMAVGEMARVGDGGDHLTMPATGPIVMEAHLVTQEEPAPYPATATDELQAHYALSQARSGLVMYRSQVWAPLEGGSFYGAGIGDPGLFPVLDEAWYVNMYWTSAARPARGTRMILRDPNGGSRAVVVAAGYETGPGNLSHVAGTPEESHFYMGTGHLDPMTIGIALDQTLPLGPRVCDP